MQDSRTSPILQARGYAGGRTGRSLRQLVGNGVALVGLYGAMGVAAGEQYWLTLVTVREYRALSRFGRACYRIYRHPFVLLGIGPFFQIYLRHRVPLLLPEPRAACVRSILGTNLALAGLLVSAHLTVGLERFLWVWVPPLVPMAWAGIWLFYVQHQFEDTYWVEPEDWSFEDAALRGSTFYDLPRPLRFFTSNIGYHHVHHLCSRIPNYRLPEFVNDHPEHARSNRLTLRDSLLCARLALFDEASSRLVPFCELDARSG